MTTVRARTSHAGFRTLDRYIPDEVTRLERAPCVFVDADVMRFDREYQPSLEKNKEKSSYL